MSEQIHTTTGRRNFIRGAAIATGAAWVAPAIISSPAGAAPVTWYLEIDPATCAAVVTTGSGLVPPCEPTGWLVGEPAPTNPTDLDWTLVENVGFDCTRGFDIIFNDANAVVIGAEAEETCFLSSPPGEVRCVTGNPLAVNQVEFPDNFVPEQCLYDVFRIIVQTGS